MNDISIKAENISKLYRLGNVNASTLRDDLNSLWARLRGKEDPTLALAQANDRTQKGSTDYVWSLKDIDFEVKKGEVLGIVGRNGAGKSTLLKILSKVTAPTTGQIKVNGRIASLLEVGTGFHPELTGKENIYLNGHILGMRKKEIDRKFDEIVDFSGVERYIDTPVKRYSSGMYVRLAFGVAAHLESDILIIDEVLAVGDAEFQKKCLGKMQDVSKGEGRTVLFVSHNLNAMLNLCPKSLLLSNGKLLDYNITQNIIDLYYKNNQKLNTIKSDNFIISNIKISSSIIGIGDSLSISFDYQKLLKKVDAKFVVAITTNERAVTSANNYFDGCELSNLESGNIEVVFPKMNLNVGKYEVLLGIKKSNDSTPLIQTSHIENFEVIFDFAKEEMNLPLDDLSNYSTPFTKYYWKLNGNILNSINYKVMEKYFWNQ